MYAKLSFRNAKRSANDYLLYITTLVGLFIGMVLSSLFFLGALSFLRTWFPITEGFPTVFATATRDSLVYFLAIQVLSLLGCLRKVRKIQIGSLMSEGRKNQVLTVKPRPFFLSAICFVSILSDLVSISFITGDNKSLMLIGTNIIIFPLVLGIWAFYKAAFHLLAWIRINKRNNLYQGSRLYLVTQMLSKITSNILMNTVLSVCLLFSVITFSVGFIMPYIPGNIFSRDMSMWMSFVEICMCIVFIAIYFSILAVRQIVESRENYHAFRMMAYLGKTIRQRRKLIKQEIVLKYTLPSVMCLIILLLCVWSLNGFLNTFLVTGNMLFIAVGYFIGCFLLMYIGYILVAYKMCVKNIA